MAGRGASTAVQTEVAKAANRPFHLIELHLDGITERSTDAYRNIDWGGQTYWALGNLLEFSGIEETAELQVNTVSISLSGVDQTLIALVLQHDYIDRRVIIRKGFLDDLMGAIIDPVPIFDGRMDAPVINEDPDGGTCVVVFSGSSHWIDFDRRPGRHTNHDEQQIWFPGDRGFEYVDQVASTDLKWGR